MTTVLTPPSVRTVPRPHESLRGFVIRTCERNGWPRYGAFLAANGLLRTDLRTRYNPAKVLAAFQLGPEHEQCFSPWNDDATGGSWPLRRMRPTQRHVCPVCLEQTGIQPDWCDLDFVFSCPLHGVALVHTCGCGKDLSFEDRSLRHCGTCAGLVTHLPQPAVAVAAAPFEHYALGRLGVVAPCPCPVLDSLPPSLAIDFVEAIGSLVGSGYSTLRLNLPSSADRSPPVEAAFAMIAAGDLGTLFRGIADQYRTSRRGGPAPPVPIRALGSFADFMPRLDGHPVAIELVRSSLERALGFPVHEVTEGDYLDIGALVHETRLGRAQIIIWLVRRNLMHLCFPRDDDLFIPIDVAWTLKSGGASSGSGSCA